MHLRHWVIFGGLFVLTGCGATPRSQPPVKLKMLGLTSEAGSRLKQDAIDEFTKNTGIEVDLIPTLGDSAQQTALILRLMNRRATAPDAYVVDLVWPGTLEHHLLDLTPYLTEEAAAHLPVMLRTGMAADRVIGLPFYMSTGTLYYRKDLLKKYGYAAPPKTWKELSRVAARIQQGERRKGRKDFWGYVWQGAAYEGLTCNALEWQASFGGGRIIENNGTVAVNNQRAVQAMDTAASWIGSISPPSVLSYTESDSLNIFRSGNAAFMRNWSSAFRRVAASMKPDSVGLAPLPAGPAGRAHTVGGFLLAASRYSSHPRQAAALISHLTSADVQRHRAIARGFQPTYEKLYRHPDLVNTLAELRTLREANVGDAVLRPSVVSGNKYADVSKAYHLAVHDILARKVPAEAGLAALETKLADLMCKLQRKHQD